VTAEVDAPLPRWAGVGASLEILALWALAGAQPVFDLFGRNAEFFLASNAGPGEILVFTLVVAFLVPLVLIAVESLFRLVRPSIGPTVHRVIIALLGATLGLNIARQIGAGNLILALLIAVAVAAGILWVQRNDTGRTVLHYLGVAPFAFALLFVFSSEAGSLMFADDAEVVEVEQGTGGPVAVIVFDELPLSSLMTREGEFNAERFPNFARLADMSTWYRNASSVAPSTPESVPTILTGQFPESGLLPTSADRPINIFTLLGGEYDVDAFEGVTDLCPDAVCAPVEQPDVDTFVDDLMGTLSDASVVYGYLTLPEDLQSHLPTLGESWAGFLDQPEGDIDEAPSPSSSSGGVVAGDPADERDDLRDFLSGRAEQARARVGQGRDLAPLIEGYSGADGSLLVGHDPFLPHRPWHITSTGAAYDGTVGGVTPGMEAWPESPAFVRRVLQRHLLQVGYADNLLGRLLDRFEEAGTLDDATIAVVADHGMAFQTGNKARSPNEANVQEIYRVPLLIKAPGQGEGEGEVSDLNALAVDVLPTILDLIGIDPPPEADFDGQSLVDPRFERADDDKPVFYGLGPDTVPGDFEDLLPAIFRDVGYVGDGGWVDLLRVGPAGDLVNRAVTDVSRGRPIEAAWSIDQQDLLDDIPDGPIRPVAIAGRVDLDGVDPDDLPTQVLVSIDGILAGVGDLDRADGSFAALLDERRLTPGGHDVGLYLPGEANVIHRLVDPGSG
jgi:hypothetical protein